jgi:4-hydroxybenzoate polyprenyltransferase
MAFAGSLLLLPIKFVAVLAGYYTLTVSYSLLLKRKVMIDVLALALLYTVRLIAGAVAIEVPVSFWLLSFSMFVFMSLALVKRYTELLGSRDKGEEVRMRGRGYFVDDLPLVASLGSASGYLSVAVLALYINDPGTARLYRHPQFIWLVCPLLLYWVSRAWLVAHRGRMHDDPIIFAVKDRVSLVVVALIFIAFALAI